MILEFWVCLLVCEMLAPELWSNFDLRINEILDVWIFDFDCCQRKEKLILYLNHKTEIALMLLSSSDAAIV